MIGTKYPKFPRAEDLLGVSATPEGILDGAVFFSLFFQSAPRTQFLIAQ
jgi:hypothetical protein